MEQKLKSAHRYFVMNVTDFRNRHPELYNPDAGIYRTYNRYVYGFPRIKTFETMKQNHRINFTNRYDNYLKEIQDLEQLEYD